MSTRTQALIARFRRGIGVCSYIGSRGRLIFREHFVWRFPLDFLATGTPIRLISFTILV
jgi:hypothetical protein